MQSKEKLTAVSEPKPDQTSRRHVGTEQQRAETREVVTPYAFEVSPTLFGTPLASPTRRGLALLVDFVIVGFLSGVTGNVLAVIIAGLLWMSGRRLSRSKGRKFAVNSLRLVSILLILGALLSVFLPPIDDSHTQNSGDGSDTEVTNEDGIKTIVLSGKYLLEANAIEKAIEQGECAVGLVCWQVLAGEFTQDLLEIELKDDVEQELLAQFSEYSTASLSPEDAAALQQYIQLKYQSLKPVSVTPSTLSNIDNIDTQVQETIAQETIAQVPNSEIDVPFEDGSAVQEKGSDVETRFYSIIEWIKGIAADLGLGFGWAAAYFTATMVLLKGQTVGKKLLRIKVIKLDGSTLNVWESFGRYGGYGAGLTTGLLGFLQVYWDPNRQAIQDKISETLVIRLEQ